MIARHDGLVSRVAEVDRDGCISISIHRISGTISWRLTIPEGPARGLPAVPSWPKGLAWTKGPLKVHLMPRNEQP